MKNRRHAEAAAAAAAAGSCHVSAESKMMAIVANNFLCLALSGGGEGEREARLDLSLKGRELLFVAKSFVCLPKAAGGGRGNC